MTELQFESLIACAEGEHIEKRTPKPSFLSTIPRGNGNTKETKSPEIHRSEITVNVTENVGRRPSVFASDPRYYEGSHGSENHERRPCLFTPNFSMVQSLKNEVVESRISEFPPNTTHEQAEQQNVPNIKVLESPQETQLSATQAQRRPSLLPSLVTMGPASKRSERAERALLIASAEDSQKERYPEGQQQTPKQGPVARLKRPQFLHRSTAPDRVAGVLELVGQGTL